MHGYLHVVGMVLGAVVVGSGVVGAGVVGPPVVVSKILNWYIVHVTWILYCAVQFSFLKILCIIKIKTNKKGEASFIISWLLGGSIL